MSGTTTQIMINGQTVDGSLALQDRTFRDAWQLEGDAITVDMAIARDIHRDALRRARALVFGPLDDIARRLSRKKDISGSLTEGEISEYAAAEVAAQALRDVTEDPRIEAADTPEELRALTLEVLTPYGDTQHNEP